MREILFRGKRKVSGEWVQGFLFVSRKGEYKIKWYDPHYGSAKTSEVFPETVGQFTGLTDQNGTKIFEGDIVDILTENEEIGVVEWDDGGFIVSADGFCVDFHTNINGTDLEVIGNIHDNPELLEVE